MTPARQVPLPLVMLSLALASGCAASTQTPSSAKEVVSFVLQAAQNPGLAGDVSGVVSGTEIAVAVPSGADVSRLTPTIAITGVSVTPSSGTPRDFTLPVVYTVTAGDGSTKAYTVTVAVAPRQRSFPAAAWMYQDVSAAPVHPRSAAITQWLQDHGSWGTGSMRIDYSIEVLEATGDTPYRTFVKTGDFYSPDCDDVPVPVPAGGALEGESGYACLSNGDCHLIVVDRRVDRLFEMWRADIAGGTFYGGCLAAWDMTRVYPPEGRGEQCTSADAAGFPMAPLLLTAEEVAAAASGGAEIDHAIRFILPNGSMRAGAYVHPATHAGGPSATSSDAPVYGSRWRLVAGFDMSRLPNAAARAVARGLQRYGMALADGGSIALTFQSDRFSAQKWAGLLGTRDLAAILPTDFEVLDTGPDVALTYDCVRTPY